MSDMIQLAVYLSLIQHLLATGHPCGWAHLRVAGVFLQEVLGVRLKMNVILSLYSIYAADLEEGACRLQARYLLKERVREREWPTYALTDRSAHFLDYYAASVAPYVPAIRFIAERLGPLSIAEVMGLGTALYVWQQHPEWKPEQQAAEVTRINPNRNSSEALADLQLLARIRGESEALKRHDAPAA